MVDPVRDSIRIYSRFFKFFLSAVSSFIIDLGMFTLLIPFFQNYTYNNIIFAALSARIISSLYNFTINKYVVFKKHKTQEANSLLKYYILVALIISISAVSVQFLYRITNINPAALKVFVDLCLFCLSYVLQRLWVFK